MNGKAFGSTDGMVAHKSLILHDLLDLSDVNTMSNNCPCQWHINNTAISVSSAKISTIDSLDF